MSYPDELCRLLLSNIKLLDEGVDVLGEIETVLFTAINARLEMLVASREGWSGTYDAVLENSSGKTYFAPEHWTELRLFYELGETDNDANYWITSALGQRKSKLCLRIAPERNPKKRRGLFSKISNCTDIFHNNDIDYDEKTGAFYVPCNVDMDKVISEYPKLDKSLNAVNFAFDRLLAGHEHYERIAKGDLAFYDSVE